MGAELRGRTLHRTLSASEGPWENTQHFKEQNDTVRKENEYKESRSKRGELLGGYCNNGGRGCAGREEGCGAAGTQGLDCWECKTVQPLGQTGSLNQVKDSQAHDPAVPLHKKLCRRTCKAAWSGEKICRT